MKKSDIALLFASCKDPREGDLTRNATYRAHLQRQRRVCQSLLDTMDERQLGLFEAYQQEVLADMLALSQHYFTQGALLAADANKQPEV